MKKIIKMMMVMKIKKYMNLTKKKIILGEFHFQNTKFINH
jgi:hypothetical protein